MSLCWPSLGFIRLFVQWNHTVATSVFQTSENQRKRRRKNNAKIQKTTTRNGSNEFWRTLTKHWGKCTKDTSNQLIFCRQVACHTKTFLWWKYFVTAVVYTRCQQVPCDAFIAEGFRSRQFAVVSCSLGDFWHLTSHRCTLWLGSMQCDTMLVNRSCSWVFFARKHHWSLLVVCWCTACFKGPGVNSVLHDQNRITTCCLKHPVRQTFLVCVHCRLCGMRHSPPNVQGLQV